MDNIELKYSGITLTLHFFRTKRRKNTINQRILNKYLKCLPLHKYCADVF